MTTTLTAPDTIGDFLLNRRTQLGWTQARVAQRAGMSVGYVGLIEQNQRGARPSIDLCRKFAQALSLELEDVEELMRIAGHLGPNDHLFTGVRTTVAEAIEGDPLLTDRQKGMVLDIYQELVGRD